MIDSNDVLGSPQGSFITYGRGQRRASVRLMLFSIYEVWLPDDDLLSRVYVRRTCVFWHEEIAEPIG